MSSEEIIEEEDFQNVGGQIVIDVSADSVRYNSDMPLPDVVFWIEAVKNMIVAQVVGENSNE